MKLLVLTLVVLSLAGCGSSGVDTSDWVTVKYRDEGKVPVCDTDIFEMIWTNIDGCPKVRGKRYQMSNAWYDKSEKYMVIRLGYGTDRTDDPDDWESKDAPTYYHYCNVPSLLWSRFKSSGGGTHPQQPYPFYLENIRGEFDCRDGGGRFVPTY
jgi:hypothetical protein